MVTMVIEQDIPKDVKDRREGFVAGAQRVAELYLGCGPLGSVWSLCGIPVETLAAQKYPIPSDVKRRVTFKNLTSGDTVHVMFDRGQFATGVSPSKGGWFGSEYAVLAWVSNFLRIDQKHFQELKAFETLRSLRS